MIDWVGFATVVGGQWLLSLGHARAGFFLLLAGCVAWWMIAEREGLVSLMLMNTLLGVANVVGWIRAKEKR